MWSYTCRGDCSFSCRLCSVDLTWHIITGHGFGMQHMLISVRLGTVCLNPPQVAVGVCWQYSAEQLYSAARHDAWLLNLTTARRRHKPASRASGQLERCAQQRSESNAGRHLTCIRYSIGLPFNSRNSCEHYSVRVCWQRRCVLCLLSTDYDGV